MIIFFYNIYDKKNYKNCIKKLELTKAVCMVRGHRSSSSDAHSTQFDRSHSFRCEAPTPATSAKAMLVSYINVFFCMHIKLFQKTIKINKIKINMGNGHTAACPNNWAALEVFINCRALAKYLEVILLTLVFFIQK